MPDGDPVKPSDGENPYESPQSEPYVTPKRAAIGCLAVVAGMIGCCTSCMAVTAVGFNRLAMIVGAVVGFAAFLFVQLLVYRTK